MLGADQLQQGVPKEWLNRLNNMECPLRAEMVMSNVEAIKRIKNRRAKLVQEYKEEIEWDALPENWVEPWKNYKDEKYITNKELEIVLQNFSKIIQCGILVI